MTSVSQQRSAMTLTVIGTLYFAQGLPFGFFTQALPAMLRASGSSLAEIGLTSLLAIPWALKFLWAPVVDRFHSSRIGKRTTWIIPLQLCSAALLVLFSYVGIESKAFLMTAVFALNLFAATQDIATDGYAVDHLRPEMRGFANGLQVAAYRVGMIVAGGVLLMLYDYLGNRMTFLVMAILSVAATLPLLASREGSEAIAPVMPQRAKSFAFLRKPGNLSILALLVIYKFGDSFATAMLRPLLTDQGVSLAQLGWILGTVGFVAGLAGALAGGALINGLGRRNSLIAFGVLQALSALGYTYLAVVGHNLFLASVFCAFEHFAGGLATAALFTCMMDWCSEEETGTDYTIQASAVVIATGAAQALAGISAQNLGYTMHFIVAVLLGLLATAVTFFLFPGVQHETNSHLRRIL